MEKLSHTGLKDYMAISGKDDSGGFAAAPEREDSDEGLAVTWQVSGKLWVERDQQSSVLQRERGGACVVPGAV